MVMVKINLNISPEMWRAFTRLCREDGENASSHLRGHIYFVVRTRNGRVEDEIPKE
jgi:hypothetical protein